MGGRGGRVYYQEEGTNSSRGVTRRAGENKQTGSDKN